MCLVNKLFSLFKIKSPGRTYLQHLLEIAANKKPCLLMKAPTFLKQFSGQQNTPIVQGWDCARVPASFSRPWVQFTVLVIIITIIIGFDDHLL